ncbi:AraC family transcriptional regulator [Paenibacillus guangzhouensis]|uniref:AraC family transcriptional regulator n=1 Tax=Paenibacillus guangzhouensis TaxID=1473112 RepID=UPI00187B9A68|nr:AraC family transcriptional regulator [Paenibacillus guangzhouensis]
MHSSSISLNYQVDDITNRYLDNFPVLCFFRDGIIGQHKIHAHRGYEFYYCLEGEGKLLVADRMYALVPGTLAIINPYVLHLPSVIGTKPLHRVILSLDERYMQAFNNSPGMDLCMRRLLSEPQPFWRLSTETMAIIRNLLQRLVRVMTDKPVYYEASMHHLLAELFVTLAREPFDPMESDNQVNETSHLAERIMRYLTAHYADTIEVSRLHERFNVSRSHMYDHFKQATGHSLNRYLTIYRINQAKRLLIDTPLSVTEIASAVGYGDLSHFFHTFKSETGITPNVFRKQTGN